MTITKYLRNISRKAVDDNPKEDIAYVVFVEFLGQHKTPAERLVIYSQLSLKWKPDIKEDHRLEIPDLGVGNFTTVGVTPPFKLRFGVEAKRVIEEMEGLPAASSIINIDEVRAAFHTLYFQAQDQAKAAIKGQYPLLSATCSGYCLLGPTGFPSCLAHLRKPNSLSTLTRRNHLVGTGWRRQSSTSRKMVPHVP